MSGRDNEFLPSTIEVAVEDEVPMVFPNRGAVWHDALIGDEAAQAEHEHERRAAESGDSDGDMAGTSDGEMSEDPCPGW